MHYPVYLAIDYEFLMILIMHTQTKHVRSKLLHPTRRVFWSSLSQANDAVQKIQSNNCDSFYLHILVEGVSLKPSLLSGIAIFRNKYN